MIILSLPVCIKILLVFIIKWYFIVWYPNSFFIRSPIDRQLGCMVVLKYVHEGFDTTSFKKRSLIPLSFSMWAKLRNSSFNGYNRNDDMQLLQVGPIGFWTSSWSLLYHPLWGSQLPWCEETQWHWALWRSPCNEKLPIAMQVSHVGSKASHLSPDFRSSLAQLNCFQTPDP